MNYKMKEIDTKYNKHWLSLASWYLKIAELWFVNIEKKKNLWKIGFWFSKKNIIKIYGEEKLEKLTKKLFNLEDGNLIIASIWNIKHWIELILKWLWVSFDKKYWKWHDLKDLSEELWKKIKPYIIHKHFDILLKIVNKYYNCDFSDKIKYFDIENTIFKYPEIHWYSLDYSFLHDLKRKDINSFINDIKKLKLIYSKLENQPILFQSMEKIWFTKKETEMKMKKAFK